jgi:holo-[acyl-carrier protein] synthase|tara:strand:+ start:820 stop:1200 length:381 start_codon:yes stop_codon:yes gene_type:complete
MKIYGIGTDIVSVNRIKKSIKSKSFLNRLFSKEEISRCSKLINSNNCYAKRFAAKEAFSKALGTGISNGINFNEIIVLNEKNGKPFIKLKGKTKVQINKKFKKKARILLSLSDEEKYAVAFVTISL